MTQKLQEIKEKIKTVYGKKLEKCDLNYLADVIYRDIFVGRGSLEGIFEAAYSAELEAGLENDKSEAWWLFDEIIDLLDDGESTAKRLYDSFMHSFDDFALFYKLIVYNREYLTEEQCAAAKQKAAGLFDKLLLRGLV